MKHIIAALATASIVTTACATSPTPSASYAKNYWTINFESIGSQEVTYLLQVGEEEFDWSAENLSGGSGFLSAEIATYESGPDTFLAVQRVFESSGYDLETLQMVASPDGSITVARIVEDGFRPY
ncbi:MAG: hypothetical protein AAF996_04755 [Pseudomonadota bacterium]